MPPTFYWSVDQTNPEKVCFNKYNLVRDVRDRQTSDRRQTRIIT